MPERGGTLTLVTETIEAASQHYKYRKNAPKEVIQLLPNEKRMPKEQKICEESDNGKEIC